MADSPSFSDVRQAVRDALAAQDNDHGEDLCVCDLGDDWVVYQDPDTVGAGMWRRSYRLDGVKAVLLSKPERVERKTTYETVGDTPQEKQPKNLSDAAKEARSRFKPSAPPDGDGDE